MPRYNIAKTAALPEVFTPNTLYLVKRDSGFDFYVSDNDGVGVRPINAEPDVDPGASTFSYNADALSRVNFENGDSKVFTYIDDLLMSVTSATSSGVIVTSFEYDTDGVLVGISKA